MIWTSITCPPAYQFIHHACVDLCGPIARERERERLVDEQHRLAAMEAGHAAHELTVDMRQYSKSKDDTPVDRLLFDALGLFIT